MYTKEEAKQLKEKFWTGFGQFMALTLSSDGVRINWVNYKTGIRHVYFRMDADHKAARIYIEISHPDTGIQELLFAQFQEYKSLLHAELGEEWLWDLNVDEVNGKSAAQIGTTFDRKVSIFQQEDWPALLSFFKPRIMALDRFWRLAKHGFDLFK